MCELKPIMLVLFVSKVVRCGSVMVINVYYRKNCGCFIARFFAV